MVRYLLNMARYLNNMVRSSSKTFTCLPHDPGLQSITRDLMTPHSCHLSNWRSKTDFRAISNLEGLRFERRPKLSFAYLPLDILQVNM
jgi:hypothetical protein